MNRQHTKKAGSDSGPLSRKLKIADIALVILMCSGFLLAIAGKILGQLDLNVDWETPITLVLGFWFLIIGFIVEYDKRVDRAEKTRAGHKNDALKSIFARLPAFAICGAVLFTEVLFMTLVTSAMDMLWVRVFVVVSLLAMVVWCFYYAFIDEVETTETKKTVEPAKPIYYDMASVRAMIMNQERLDRDRGFLEVEVNKSKSQYAPGIANVTGERHTILIVEDNPDALHLLRKTLERQDYRVITAATLAEAREWLPVQLDLIILDNDLPDGKGLDFLRELRQTSQVPVIMATGRVGKDMKMAAAQAGCDDFIEKPYTLDMITEGIEKILCQGNRDAPIPQ